MAGEKKQESDYRDAEGRIKVAIFENDTVVTFAEYESMNERDVMDRDGFHSFKYWTQEWCEQEGVDMTYLEEIEAYDLYQSVK
jgi:hypothetical protein